MIKSRTNMMVRESKSESFNSIKTDLETCRIANEKIEIPMVTI